jgi:hypothetical protein
VPLYRNVCYSTAASAAEAKCASEYPLVQSVGNAAGHMKLSCLSVNASGVMSIQRQTWATAANPTTVTVSETPSFPACTGDTITNYGSTSHLLQLALVAACCLSLWFGYRTGEARI